MKIRTAIQWLVVGSLCASASAGDAPGTPDLRAPSRWRVGECVTETETITTTSTVTVRQGGVAPREVPGGRTSQDSTIVRKCLELGDDGRPSKMLLFVKAWKSAGGGPEDCSLRDAVLELRRDGWRLLTPDLELTPKARAWLTGDLLLPTASGEAAATELLPAGSSAEGTQWTPESAGSISVMLRRLGFDPSAKGTQTQCKVTSLAHGPDGDSIRVEHETVASTAPPDGAGAKALHNSVRITGFVEGTAGAWHRTLGASSDTDVRMAYEKDGRSIEVHSQGTITTTHSAGGEIPAWDPPAPDEDATRCAFARAAAHAGDVVTENGSDDYTVTTRAEDCACAPCPAPEETRSTEWTAVRRAADVGADGRATRERVFLKAWTHTEKGATDTSIAGASFDVTADGWKLAGDATPSDAARKWIAERAPAGRDPLAPLAPATPQPARAGTLWMPDTVDVAKSALWNDGFRIEPEHATGRCKIVDAQEADGAVVAKVRYHTETPASGTVGEGDKRVTAIPGSQVKVSGSASGPVAAWGQLGERRTEIEFDVFFQREGRIGRLATNRKLWLEVTPGGEMPPDAK